MIQMRTILEVADNSGAKKISCIHLRGGSQGQYAELGARWLTRLRGALARSPHVREVRGRGLLVGNRCLLDDAEQGHRVDAGEIADDERQDDTADADATHADTAAATQLQTVGDLKPAADQNAWPRPMRSASIPCSFMAASAWARPT